MIKTYFKKRLDTGVALQAISSKLDNKSDIKFNNIKRLAVLKKTIPVLIGGAPHLSMEAFIKKYSTKRTVSREEVMVTF